MVTLIGFHTCKSVNQVPTINIFRVDTTLYFSMFQPYNISGSTWEIEYQGEDWLGEYEQETRFVWLLGTW